MNRSRSPKFVAFAASLIAAVISSVAVAILTKNFIATGINLLLVFGVCYFIFIVLLKKFIYDKIKLIYRNIYRFKTRSTETYGALDKKESDPIGAVSKEVLGWMKENRKEVNDLKKQENYRREFLGNVSHELKTPIQNIQGYIHTLLDGALNDKKVNERFLSKAAASADRLVELVENLTTIGTLEEGQSIDIQEFDLLKLTKDVVEMVENIANEKSISVVYKKQNPKTLQVHGDRAKIRQVLLNLLVNAVKYGKKEGEITIGFYDMDKVILTEISDDGNGIEEEHLPRLFERFYRTDSGRSRDLGGSGLGLSIVKHIIEAHQQTVNVRSTIGVGSTFGFTLKKG
ncbi:ATP-binding protein [Bacteroidia bacterium]|nr:ATP-binding protein [Bacteroidia bacterium]MDC1395002.1 ATP-binding protein [Bacteroidia bacterium]